MTSLYQFVLELLRANGDALDQVPLVPDWEPAVESTRLARLRSLGDWIDAPEAEPLVEPLWHADSGEPYVRGFRVRLAGPEGRDWSEDFPAPQYFADAARAAAARLVESGALAAGDRVLFRTAAFAKPAEEPAAWAPRFDMAERAAPLGLRDRPLAAVLAGATTCGESCDADVEVLLPQRVVDEATALTLETPARETGGILIGHLHRDPGTGEVFVGVTAQVAARHTEGDATKLTFTSETWTDVRHTIALRRRDEQILGWWHSHPAGEWCKTCPPERQRTCHLQTGFFSDDDKALHRTVFSRAYTVALVMTNAISGVSPALFGWRSGLIQPRAFRLLADHISS